MKILLITPGSGDRFFCGNCFRDHLYAHALRNAGYEVVMMPLYLPIAAAWFDAATPLFFPATSYYVAHQYFGKRAIPRFLEKVLDAPPLLRFASSLSGTTSAAGMEQMTLSMIQGDDHHFARQAQKIIHRIVHHERPDVVHLSSSLLIGIAKAIKNQIDIPIICSLQDEEIWIDGLDTFHAREAWKSIGQNAKYIDRFMVSSQFYKSVVLHRMPEITEVRVVYPGVELQKYASSAYPDDPTIGFFYRMSAQNGLDILAEAFILLKKENTIERLKLHIGGGCTPADKKFLRKIHKMLAPFTDCVVWHQPYTPARHAPFYQGISAICVPITFEESVGLYLCEAFAAGRPAVGPDTGSFAEIMADGGVLYQPNTPDALARAIQKLFADKDYFASCSQNALRLSQHRYNQNVLADQLSEIYLPTPCP